MLDALMERAGARCELCAAGEDLAAYAVDGEPGLDRAVLLCAMCRGALEAGEAPEGGHWQCLRTAIWSEVGSVQVLAYRVANGLRSESWAAALLDEAYLDEDVQAWAERGLPSVDEGPVPTDSHGNRLADGDSVTLIKDLPVKGANFTAKRGTMVKGIRVGEDPTHVEGKVNGMSIMLKTEFLKRA